MPRVSVIIPTYNRAQFIEKAIASILNQTYLDWELIVVDDGSQDETEQVVAQFSNRIIYIRQDNAGPCVARNIGFAASQGELVTFLDSDDQMLPHNLAVLVALLDEHPDVGIAYGWYYWIDEQGNPGQRGGPEIKGQEHLSPWPGLTPTPRLCGAEMEGQILPQLLLQESMLMGTSLIRRKCIEAIGGFDPAIRFQEHWDFYLRLAQAGFHYQCCKQPVTLLRLHPGNRGTNLEAMLVSHLATLERFLNHPEWQSQLAEIRSRAYYNAYASFAQYNYKACSLEQGTACLQAALNYAPLSVEDAAVITASMVQAILKVHPSSPVEQTHALLESLPLTNQVDQLRRQVLGQLHQALAYQAYQAAEASQVIWHHLFQTIRYERSLFRRRELLLACKALVRSLGLGKMLPSTTLR